LVHRYVDEGIIQIFTLRDIYVKENGVTSA
jgi:hypothetical protein